MNVTEHFLRTAMNLGLKHKIQYVDWPDNEWTLESLVTESRIQKILSDDSIKTVAIIINYKEGDKTFVNGKNNN